MSNSIPISASPGLYRLNVTGGNGETFQLTFEVEPENALDTVWLFTSSVLILMMQLGFSMLEAGIVRINNTKTLLFKNMYDLVVGTIAFYACGYAFAFGKSVGGFIGTTGFFLQNAANERYPSTMVHFFFQLTFSATAATIDSGGVAERMDIGAYCLSSFSICFFIYPVVVHWIWNSQGWLAQMGFKDFAGGCAVHVVGGSCALIGSMMVGPRIGLYDSESRKPNKIFQHNVVLQALGTWILLIGWFGFNVGSTYSVLGTLEGSNDYLNSISGCSTNEACSKRSDLASLVMVNTLLSAVSSAFTASIVHKLIFGLFDVEHLFNGLLSGLVGITAGCGFVSIPSSILIGTSCGILYLLVSKAMVTRCFVDDPLDAFVVHGMCGIWGTLCVGLFDLQDGLFLTGNFRLFGVQLLGGLVVFSWTCFFSWLSLISIKKCYGSLRVPPAVENSGCDSELLGGPAYHMATEAKRQDKAKGVHLVAELLRTVHGVQLFTSFLRERYCDEILNLFLAIDAYEKRGVCSTSEINMIYDQYISPRAPMQVNFPDWIIKSISSRRNIPSLSIFTDAKSACVDMMIQMCDQYFVKSKHFHMFLALQEESTKKLAPLRALQSIPWCNTSSKYQVQELSNEDRLEEVQLRNLLQEKILLLGASESGKTTLLKQVSVLFGMDLTSTIIESCIRDLHRNIIECMQVLVEQLDHVGLSLETVNARSSKDIILNVDCTDPAFRFDSELAGAIDTLWNSESIQSVYSSRKKYWLPENAEMFLTNVQRFAGGATDDVFSPKVSDFLMAWHKTTNSTETTYVHPDPFTTPEGTVAERTITFVDVGGCRLERRKWSRHFDDANAILFLINLNSYHTVLREDPSVCGIKEAMNLLKETFDGRRFKSKRIILGFNKLDLFELQYNKDDLRNIFPTANPSHFNEPQNAANYIVSLFCDILARRGYSNVKSFLLSCFSPLKVKQIVNDITATDQLSNTLEITNLLRKKAKREQKSKSSNHEEKLYFLPGADYNYLGYNVLKEKQLARISTKIEVRKEKSSGFSVHV